MITSEVTIEARELRLAYRMARNRSTTMKQWAVNMTKRQLNYEELWALDGVSFDVKRGETFAVIGPNGGGKTTLMKVLAGVLPPTEGRAIVHGSIAPMISLGGGINQEMTGAENIILFGTLLGRDPAEMRSRSDEIADWSGLEEFMDVPVHAYSSGMQARLAFAIATDVKPEVLIIDEVLAVGDEAFKKKSMGRIEDLMSGGTSVVLVSHALPTVKRLADRVLWLEKGHVKMIGSAEEVVDIYASTA